MNFTIWTCTLHPAGGVHSIPKQFIPWRFIATYTSHNGTAIESDMYVNLARNVVIIYSLSHLLLCPCHLSYLKPSLLQGKRGFRILWSTTDHHIYFTNSLDLVHKMRIYQVIKISVNCVQNSDKARGPLSSPYFSCNKVVNLLKLHTSQNKPLHCHEDHKVSLTAVQTINDPLRQNTNKG